MENNNNFFNLQNLGQDTYGYVELPEVTKELPFEDWLMKTYKITREEAEAAAFQANLNYIAKTGDTSTLPEGYTVDHIPGTRLILTGYGGLTHIANPTSIIGPDGKVAASYDPIKNVKFNTLDPADNGANDLIFDIFTLGAGAANGALKTTGKAAYKLGLKGTQAFFKYTVPSTYIKPLASRLFKASPYTSRIAGLWGDNLMFSTLGGAAASNFIRNPNLETGTYAALGLLPYGGMIYRPFINSKFVQAIRNLKLAQGLHAADVGRGRSFHDLLELYSHLEYPTKTTGEPTLTKHLLGDEAIRMFKEYGGESIPEGSINGEQLRRYVPEARERYGIVGDTRITDEEIAQALYKHVKELGGNTAAKNLQGEPLLLFRGDTKPYTELRERISPEKAFTMGGTMDNSLGTLFLGELPFTDGGDAGILKYLNSGAYAYNSSGDLIAASWRPSQTGGANIKIGNKVYDTWKLSPTLKLEPSIASIPEGAVLVDEGTPTSTGLVVKKYKLPLTVTDAPALDINAFVVKTPSTYNMSNQMQVLGLSEALDPRYNFLWLTDETPRAYLDKDGFPLISYKGNDYTNLYGNEARPLWADLYRAILDNALKNDAGLLVSEPMSPFRNEHRGYTYVILPNFNIRGAKHILPYDLRIPRDWNDKNIYRVLFPAGLTFMGLNNIQDNEESKIQ